MSRAKSKALLVLERLEQVLLEDIAAEPELWFATPATVTIEPTPATRESPRPLVVIVVDSSEPGEKSVSDLGPVTNEALRCTAFLETENVDDPQAAGLELMSDFRRFIGRHRQLEAADGEPWLECGWIEDQGYELFVDFQEGGKGGALVELRFELQYQWSGETA